MYLLHWHIPLDGCIEYLSGQITWQTVAAKKKKKKRLDNVLAIWEVHCKIIGSQFDILLMYKQ